MTYALGVILWGLELIGPQAPAPWTVVVPTPLHRPVARAHGRLASKYPVVCRPTYAPLDRCSPLPRGSNLHQQRPFARAMRLQSPTMEENMRQLLCALVFLIGCVSS